jgi:hypothetical protein
MKRAREDLEEDGTHGEAIQGEQAGKPQAVENDDDNMPLSANYKMSKTVRKGWECPYLDTISRQVRQQW